MPGIPGRHGDEGEKGVQVRGSLLLFARHTLCDSGCVLLPSQGPRGLQGRQGPQGEPGFLGPRGPDVSNCLV